MAELNTTAEKPLLFGCADWQHARWEAEYYPADLPADWRLSYYANDMDCVLLPEQCWRGVDAAVLEGWREDVAPGFLFFLESSIAAGDEAALGQASALGSALGGVVSATGLARGASGYSAPVPCANPQAGLVRGVLLLDIRNSTLREQRGLLERSAPGFAAYDQVAIIVCGQAQNPEQTRDFVQLAQLMDLA